MKKLTSNLYTESKGYHNYEQAPKGYLFAHHPTCIRKVKMTKDDLPEHYVYGYYYGHWGWLNTKDIKFLKYRPIPMLENHLFKDDFLLISYDKPIKQELGNYSLDHCGYDEFVYGHEIIDILNAAKKYAGYDIEPIKEEIWQKILTLKDVEGFRGESYYDEIEMSREVFNSWWE